MVTKEQCILSRVIELMGYDRNPNLTKYVLGGYNQGKNYLADCVFQNNEAGLDYALERYSPSEIINLVTGEDSEYNADYPMFVFDGGTLRSISEYEFRRMLKPEDTQKILNKDVLEELDDSDFFDAFEIFVEKNYPEFYRQFDYDMLDGFNSYDYINKNWDEVVKSLMQRQVNEGRVLEMTRNELASIVSEGTMKVLEKIEIKPENKGKFTATKKRTGKSTEELTHSKNPLTRKRAVFAQNVKKWNHSK